MYKFLRTGLKSNYDGSPWVVGQWRTVAKPVETCIGLNASRLIQDALRNVQGEVLARVETGGTIIKAGDKWTCEKMRIVEWWPWTKKKSVRLAIYAASQVLDLYETQYPDDLRPRQAIEAAQKYLDNPSESQAARSVWAAQSAEAEAAEAEAAARSAAWAARSAWWSARSAESAESEAESAWAAAWSAESAESAAWAAESAVDGIQRRIHLYALKIAKE